VDLVVAAIGALDDSIVGDLSLFLLFPFSVVDDRSAVACNMIYMPSISFPARLQEDGAGMEHVPFRNIVVCPPKSNRLIDRKKYQKVEVWSAST